MAESWFLPAFGVLLVLGMAAFFAGQGSRAQRLVRFGVVFGSGVAAVVLYALIGRPGMTEQPFAARAAELASRDPAMMNRDELLVRLQALTRERPDDPEPHFFIGEVLKSEGRLDEAIRAYQSALRRDPDYVPALLGVADGFTTLENGRVSPEVAQIYAQVYRLDPSKVRAGFMSGLDDWAAGDKAAARAVWDAVTAAIPEGDPRAGMMAALVASVEEAEGTTP